MTRRERENAERRRLVIEAARILFVRDGFEKVGMDEIARLSEFSRKTLYQYYRSKLDLLVVVVMNTLSEFYKQAYDIIEQKSNFSQYELLNHYCMFYFEWNRSHTGEFSLLQWYDIAVHNEATKLSPEVVAQLEKWRLESPPIVSRILHDGIKSGEFRKDLEPELAEEFFHKALYGIAHQYILHPRFPDSSYELEIEYLLRAFVPLEKSRTKP